MGHVSTYDIQKIVCSWKDVEVNGFQIGEAIDIAPADEDFKVQIGSHGAAIFQRMPNHLYQIKMTLLYGQPSLEALVDEHLADLRDGLIPGTFDVYDLINGSYFNSDACAMVKLPNMKYAVEQDPVELNFVAVAEPGLDAMAFRALGAV